MNSAADHRPEGRRDRAGGGDEPVRARAVGLPEVRRDERHDRRHDQHRAEAFEERPADDQHRQVRGQRRRQRSAGVDDAPDRERALPADDLADLAAGDHQGGHHQRVQRDRRLDPGDRRPDVAGDRGDRRVHDGRVQGHDELPRRQRQQDDPRGAGALRSRLGHEIPWVGQCVRLIHPWALTATAYAGALRGKSVRSAGSCAGLPCRPRSLGRTARDQSSLLRVPTAATFEKEARRVPPVSMTGTIVNLLGPRSPPEVESQARGSERRGRHPRETTWRSHSCSRVPSIERIVC